MANKTLMKAIFICLVALGGLGLVPVYAQRPGEDPPEPVVATPAASEGDVIEIPEVQEPAELANLAPSGRLNLTLQQLGYNTDQFNGGQLQGLYRINLPGNFKILPTGNYLNLVTSHLVETPNQSASLQVDLNGTPVSVINLSASTNAVSQTTRIDLAQALLRTGRNSLALSLDTGLTCEEPGAAVEVLVDQNSTLSFEYEQVPYPTNLALYPFPFTEESLFDIPVVIILPDTPTSHDLSVAGTIAGGLGRMSGGNIDLTAVPASEIAPETLSNAHLIVVGRADNNSLLKELELTLPLDSPILEAGHGVLQEIVSPWNEYRLVLVVSGTDDEGVSKASQALNRQAHFLGVQGPVAVVLDLLPLSKAEATRAASMSLASLGYDDEVAYGALPRDFVFDFDLPLAWRLEESPFVVLKFAHSDILDPYQSILDIKLNNLPIGSTLLDDQNANEGELTVTLPGDRLKAGRNRLVIGVKMSLANVDPCSATKDSRAWTVVSNESEIFLPYNPLNLAPDLKLLPYPFSQNSGFDQTLIVLPDQPTSSNLDDLMQLTLRLGSASQLEYISAHVAYASEVDKAAREAYHIILLGRSTENPLLAEINESLPQPFVPESDMLKPLVIDSVAFMPDPNRDAGLLEIITSPWNENLALLAITGTTNEGVKLALQTLLNETGGLEGNLAVIEPATDPLAQDPVQISVYSIDTRSSSSNEESSLRSLSESDLVLLSKRWWR
jgi:hypothetical protein